MKTTSKKSNNIDDLKNIKNKDDLKKNQKMKTTSKKRKKEDDLKINKNEDDAI